MSSKTEVTLLNEGTRLAYTARLVVEVCCCCGVPFGIPESLMKQAREDPDQWFWCVNGHKQHYTESEATKLRRQLNAARQRADRAEQTARYQRQRAERSERSASAFKGVATRQRNRIARGVCPCCNRYFPAMDAHMAAKHPRYAGEPLVPDASQ